MSTPLIFTSRALAHIYDNPSCIIPRAGYGNTNTDGPTRKMGKGRRERERGREGGRRGEKGEKL
jgi:hypothetical protein